jgi:phosphohistidine swiveling domain-containing protein
MKPLVVLAGHEPAARQVGGKGATLARLAATGLRVPEALAITTETFEEALRAAGVETLLRAAEERLPEGLDREALAALRAGLGELTVPTAVLRSIEEAWRRWGAERVIVRSSATVEDGSTHSFAGMFESRPVTERDDLAPAIRAVWSSLAGERAVTYCQMAGLSALPRMAVVVQPFVEATRSGVLFTRFPGPDGEDRMLVEHVEGDCEKLVLGEVDPDRAWLPLPSDEDDVRPDEAGLLSRATVAELREIAARLEEVLGGPQDVEWALAGDTLYVLQSRPITSVPARGSGGRSGEALLTDRAGLEPLLTGLGASAGRAGGPAQLVFHIHDADSLAAGDVLVTRMTNPDMVTAMQRSAAVVADVGGMICHAAIVSRELGIPCVVGAGSATASIGAGDAVTVDGDMGRVYAGLEAGEGRPAAADPPRLDWAELWRRWIDLADRDQVPLVHTVDGLESCPRVIERVCLVPDADLALDERMHARHLGALDGATRRSRFEEYIRRVGRVGVTEIRVLPRALAHADELLRAALAAGLVAGHEDGSPDGRSDGPSDGPSEEAGEEPEGWPEGVRQIPLAALGVARDPAPAGGARGAGDTGSEGSPGQVFGTAPATRAAPMPPTERRRAYLELLPRLAEAHRRSTARPGTDYPWIDARPEVVITPLLKSVVLAGMETVPLALGFEDLEPMHVQWIGCRFHFRADTFGATLPRLMSASWDGSWLDDLLARTRRSYDDLEAAAARLPAGEETVRALGGGELRAAIVPWWRAFVDFFALSFFIQAQGDDCMAPAIAAAVTRSSERARRAGLGADRRLPGVAELTAPTTPVMTAEYMASLLAVREAMEEAGCPTPEAALGSEAALAAIDRHLASWFWMRERDPYFAPYDRPEVVARQALKVGEAPLPDHAANAARGRFALAFHMDLAASAGEAGRLVYAVGWNHRLALERENHHIVWLRASYRFRELVLECERRLREACATMLPADAFFFELPELLDAVEALPAPPPAEHLSRVRNRRLAYLREARLQDPGGVSGSPEPEPDYV